MILKKNRKSRNKVIAEINVVPYIDVMLVLLVIFMVTAPLLQQGVAVDLPHASAEPVPPSELEPIVLSVDDNGQYFLNISDAPTVPIALSELQLRVAADLARHPKRTVLVKADQGISYGTVVTAMVVLQRSGAKQVGLITDDQPPELNQGSLKRGKA